VRYTQVCPYSPAQSDKLLKRIDSPKTPLILLPFAVKVFLTTMTCMLEFPQWQIPFEQKVTLCTLYGPYLLLCKLITHSCSRIIANFMHSRLHDGGYVYAS
jgi:hypothetical protein